MDEVRSGCLYVVATPIGNLKDITLRALDVLRQVDLIAAEDTRRTRGLLEHYAINTPLLSYHEHNEAVRTQELIEKLRSGMSIALVSDAGTPLVSDPGYNLVAAARGQAVPVIPVPGPCAAIAALMGAGLASDKFVFYGFVPKKASQRQQRWKELAGEKRTAIMYESPNRLIRTLQEMAEYFPHRAITVARELTKVHEEFISGSVTEVWNEFSGRGQVKGEIVIVLAGTSHPDEGHRDLTDSELIRMVADLMEMGSSKKQAVKQVAEMTGRRRQDVYALAVDLPAKVR